MRQSHRLGFELESGRGRDLPLVGTASDPRQFVTKDSMIAALRFDVDTLKKAGVIDEGVEINSFTGHSFRRSGVKRLARMGTPLDLIMHLSRHSSAAVHGYIEEAYEESPIEQRKFVEYSASQHQLAHLARQRETFAKVVEGLADRLEQSANYVGQDLDEASIMRIAFKIAQPQLVMNLETKKVRSTSGCSFQGPPLQWATRCGWKWVGAECQVMYISDQSGLPAVISICDKCQAHLPDWAS